MILPGLDTLELRPYNPANERVLTCTGCGTEMLVCGHVLDLDPDTFRGVFCCQVSHEDWDTGQKEAAA